MVDKIRKIWFICGTEFEKGDDRYNHLDHYKASMAGADVVTEIFHITESILSMASGHEAHSNKLTEAAEYQKAIKLGEQKLRQLTRNLEGDTKERIEALESKISDLTVELRETQKRILKETINQSSNSPEIRNRACWNKIVAFRKRLCPFSYCKHMTMGNFRNIPRAQ